MIDFKQAVIIQFDFNLSAYQQVFKLCKVNGNWSCARSEIHELWIEFRFPLGEK